MIDYKILEIPDLILIEPKAFHDDRGFFYESYNKKDFEDVIGKKINFVQDNHSKSIKSVLRGLHFQSPPHAQDKLVRAVRGEIYDVAVDLRVNSKHFGSWCAELLTDKNKRQMWIPKGFAHGFLVISDEAEICYKTSSFYNKSSDISIKWNDKDLDIKWPKLESDFLISSKDINAISFKEYKDKPFF